MDSLAFTKLFENSQSAVLSTQQIAVLLNMDIKAATVKLHRLVKSKVVVRIQRGKYTLPSDNIHAVACSIYHPSYITLLSAFEYHGTTTQFPRIIDIFNPLYSGKIQLNLDAGSFVVRFVKVGPNLIYGYDKIFLNGTTAFIAQKEKAIVDSLMLPEYVPLDETLSCLRSGIELKKVIEYARLTKRQTVLKRLGFLLSREGSDISSEAFGKISSTYVPLDPALPRRGKYDSTWRIIENRVME